MKWILYDMGPLTLTLVRWLLQRAFKFKPPLGTGSKLKKVPPSEVELSTYFLNHSLLRGSFNKKIKKLMEFSIKLAGWVLDDPVFH